MSKILKDAFILLAITAVAGILLGFTYNITKDPIARQEKAELDNALNAVVPNATFTEIDLVGEPSYVSNVYEGKDVDGNSIGYAFKVVTTEGYGGEIQLVIGFGNGKINAIDVVKQGETPGLGANCTTPKFKDQFEGKKIKELKLVKTGDKSDQNIDALSGATVTSRAVTNAFNEAIDYYNTNIKEAE